MRLFTSKLQRAKLPSIQERFLTKYFKIYNEAVGKFALFAFLVCFKFMPNAIDINFLLTSLARSAQRDISDLGLFVQTSPYGLGLFKNLGPIFLCADVVSYLALILDRKQ